MYLGTIAEMAERDDLYGDPRAPYTRVLLQAAPRLAQIGRAPEPGLKGDPPSAVNIPAGCRFHTRCPRAEERCSIEEPELLPVDGGGTPRDGQVHLAACHFRRERVGVPARATSDANDGARAT